MRHYPNLEGKIRHVLKKDERIIIISRTPSRATIGGSADYWYNVRKGNDNGWIFGAFLDRKSFLEEKLEILTEKKMVEIRATQYSLDGILGPDTDITLDTLNKYFGSGSYRFIEKVTNKHDGSMDEVYEMKYPGLTVKFYHAIQIRRHIPYLITLEKPSPRSLWGLTVGSTLKDLKEKIGDPNATSGDTLIYLSDPLEEGTVNFKISNERIQSITWSSMVD